MNSQRRRLLSAVSAFAALALVLPSPGVAASKKPIQVVATFSILGDMVKRIGGKHVNVTTLVGSDSDAHVYRPTPADVRAVSKAKILVVNGLQFEGWLDRLVGAADFKGVRVVATKGIDPIAMDEDDDHDDKHKAKGHDHKHKAKGHDHKHEAKGHDHKHEAKGHDHKHKAKGHDHKHEAKGHDHKHKAKGHDHKKHKADDHAHKGGHHDHGAYDPHTWQSLKNAVIYVNNIAAALSKAAPEHAKVFQQNRDKYIAEIKALDKEIGGILGKLPKDRRTIVTSHDAFQYFGRAYGLTFVAPQGISTESKPSAKDVARLINFIRKNKIRAVFVESITDPRLLKRIADETGAAIGGTLYPGALSGPKGPAPTYLDMMRHNAKTIAKALSS